MGTGKFAISALYAVFFGFHPILNYIEKEKHDTHVKLIALLKKAKLTISDLKPKFKCNKCNDTGFDGTSKCSCYEDVVAECQKEI